MVTGPPERDAELMQRFRAGDGDAFRTLFERHAGLLEGWIERRLPHRLRRRVAVSDVVQETRLVAYTRRGDFEDRGPEAFRKWILGIGGNKLREAIRRHAGTAKRAAQLEVTRGDRLDTGQFPSSDGSPSQVAMSAEIAERAQQALERLPDDYRQVLRLTRHEGLDFREAAARMGRSPDAVRMLCGRAMLRFQEVFTKLGGDRP